MTSYGRLRLYKMLDRLQESCIYSDIDSAFMIDPRNIQDSISAGHYLGDVESELLPQDYITEFVSLGPKTYAYTTAEDQSVVKAKGFT